MSRYEQEQSFKNKVATFLIALCFIEVTLSAAFAGASASRFDLTGSFALKETEMLFDGGSIRFHFRGHKSEFWLKLVNRWTTKKILGDVQVVSLAATENMKDHHVVIPGSAEENDLLEALQRSHAGLFKPGDRKKIPKLIEMIKNRHAPDVAVGFWIK